jgi:hypothetical protein
VRWRLARQGALAQRLVPQARASLVRQDLLALGLQAAWLARMTQRLKNKQRRLQRAERD